MPSIPEYIVSSGISGSTGPTSWGTYVRRPTGSLRRVCSIDLPLQPTREKALADLAFWLQCKISRLPSCDREPYRRQLERVKAEIVALGGQPTVANGWR